MNIRKVFSIDIGSTYTKGALFALNGRASRVLAQDKSPTTPRDLLVLYAGNAKQQDEIRELLKNKTLVVTENLLPEIGRLNIEPARAAIHEIFMKRIVAGKGLAKVAAMSSAPLKPTPRAVFDLLATLPQTAPEWDDLILIDLGGATTDFYSCTESFTGKDAAVLRGMEEPKLKRTVEGDLGLRLSARAVYESAGGRFQRRLAGEAVAPVLAGLKKSSRGSLLRRSSSGCGGREPWGVLPKAAAPPSKTFPAGDPPVLFNLKSPAGRIK
ncbi:MAG: glutamate mutase L [Kiritimatiellae bacterium]|nr:glutamate mutase L [Kiritimatiellia bacterium]